MISAKWIYTWKGDERGRVVKAKARLVARGFSQREGIDFFETYAPTPSASCIRLLASIACELDLDLCHFDAEQAFVQSELKEEVFLRLPQGCGDMSGRVVRLNRSLYGLRQASRTWHHHLIVRMKILGFEQCLADACVLRLIEDGAVSIIAVVHVDDIFAAGLKSRCDRFCEDLNELVPINNIGELTWYAGCHYSRDRANGMLTISQKTFTDQLVDKYGVTLGKKNPGWTGEKFDRVDDAGEAEGDWPFREVVGSLMWLANQTRPDISDAVRAVARYCHAPKLVHWQATLCILQYLKSTSNFGITFQRGSGIDLEVYADANYAEKATDRRSVSGGVVICGGATVSWFSRTQKCVTLSTTEAEYVAMGDAVKEALFLRHVWCFLFPDRAVPCMKVFEDNMDGCSAVGVEPSEQLEIEAHRCSAPLS